MSIIENYWSSARTDSVSPNNNKAEGPKTDSSSEKNVHVTKMQDSPLGRDLVKQPKKEEPDSNSYNSILLGIADLIVCQSKRDVKTVKNMIDKHPDVIEMLRQPKDAAGEDLLTPADICGVIINCKEALRKHPDRVLAVLSNPEEINSLKNTPEGQRCIGVYRALVDPLKSTIEINPDAFSKDTAKTPLDEFVKTLDFPKKFDKKEFEKWAEDSGLTMVKDPFSYKMLNEDGEVVRAISVDERSGKIISDKVSKFDETTGRETACFMKVGISKDINVSMYDAHGSVEAVAKITPDGIWRDLSGKVLETNPLTNEKQ